MRGCLLRPGAGGRRQLGQDLQGALQLLWPDYGEHFLRLQWQGLEKSGLGRGGSGEVEAWRNRYMGTGDIARRADGE